MTIAFIVGTSFLSRTVWLEWLDIIFGLIILADFSARLSMSVRPIKEFAHPATWADMVAIVSFLGPKGQGLGFLRIREHSGFSRISSQRFSELTVTFLCNEEVIIAVVNLAVFLFIMTGVVYQTQHWSNPAIANYIDALYFTITALTMTWSWRHHSRARRGGSSRSAS